eukprot:m.127868 g.127868  ORF g.127868 m.127868 type:complete len:126 (+) comp9736_c0_seq4:3-380(+)
MRYGAWSGVFLASFAHVCRQLSKVIVEVLNKYRKDDCKVGRITSKEDFKYLAKKVGRVLLVERDRRREDQSIHCVVVSQLCKLILEKESKKGNPIPTCDEDFKHKAKNFCKSYMKQFGAEFQRKN